MIGQLLTIAAHRRAGTAASGRVDVQMACRARQFLLTIRRVLLLQVSYSAVLYYGYIGVIGVAVWAVLKYFKSGVSLPQIWCTYGAAALAQHMTQIWRDAVTCCA